MRKILFLLVFCTLNFLSFGQCNRMVDSLALVDLYNGTVGQNWLYTWDLNEPMSTWYGITLNPDGCVKCIDLDGRLDCGGYAFNNLGNNLTGYIPESIGNLTQIEHISLGNNFLTGDIPTSLGQLQSLRELILRYNDLTGTIPAELGNFPFLGLLNLTSNELIGEIPPEIGGLPYLSDLFLGDNNLTGSLPLTFSQQTLLALNLDNNNLSGEIPPFLGEIILSRLAMHNNELVGCFPQELEALCGKDINFSGNIALPWQGNFDQFCNSPNQIGAPCEDGLDYTINYIDENCDCFAMVTTTIDIPEHRLSIYPNPIQSKVVILNKDKRTNFNFTLFSTEGHKLFSFQEYHFDVSNLHPGIYLLRAENSVSGTSSIHKLVKL